MVLNTREGHASIRVASVNAPEWGIRVWESMRAMSADSSIIEECAVEALVSTELESDRESDCTERADGRLSRAASLTSAHSMDSVDGDYQSAQEDIDSGLEDTDASMDGQGSADSSHGPAGSNVAAEFEAVSVWPREVQFGSVTSTMAGSPRRPLPTPPTTTEHVPKTEPSIGGTAQSCHRFSDDCPSVAVSRTQLSMNFKTEYTLSGKDGPLNEYGNPTVDPSVSRTGLTMSSPGMVFSSPSITTGEGRNNIAPSSPATIIAACAKEAAPSMAVHFSGSTSAGASNMEMREREDSAAGPSLVASQQQQDPQVGHEHHLAEQKTQSHTAVPVSGRMDTDIADVDMRGPEGPPARSSLQRKQGRGKESQAILQQGMDARIAAPFTNPVHGNKAPSYRVEDTRVPQVFQKAVTGITERDLDVLGEKLVEKIVDKLQNTHVSGSPRRRSRTANGHHDGSHTDTDDDDDVELARIPPRRRKKKTIVKHRPAARNALQASPSLLPANDLD
ncbi:hypothetical protein HWV62_34457 [Athelia sp. TMB]|nr:hypothetical protein HWV62_34457 [Athelia sp. TMB]